MSCITKQPSFLNVIFHAKCDLLVLKSVVVPYDNGILENNLSVIEKSGI